MKDTLSDKLRCNGGTNKEHIRDVRAFINELKHKFCEPMCCEYASQDTKTLDWCLKIIDKLAGEELI